MNSVYSATLKIVSSQDEVNPRPKEVHRLIENAKQTNKANFYSSYSLQIDIKFKCINGLNNSFRLVDEKVA
ncbi:MAG: hypothetical protein N4A33_08645 [Bacteriovoracaceae bacterium]|nr:hypothetical protein [Bacteriovoracaceae bacterium]